MPNVSVELVVFTIQNNELSIVPKEDRLPKASWSGENDPDVAARILADGVAPGRLRHPVFVRNNYEVGELVIVYALTASPSDLAPECALIPLGATPNKSLSKLTRTKVYDAKQWLLSSYETVPLIPAMLGDSFTLTQFQDAVEAITGQAPDKRHFRRQHQESDWFEYTGEKLWGAHRPAMLYRVSGKFIEAFGRHRALLEANG